MKTIHLPIRALAEFVLRQGDIDSRFGGLNRAVEGGRIHRMLQRRGGKHYAAEVKLELEIPLDGLVFCLGGRADGVIESEEGLVVDEIKTTVRPLESMGENDNPAHWAQGCCYAHILCVQRGLPAAGVQLTYYNVDTGNIRRFVRSYTSAELAELVENLLARYLPWARHRLNWGEKRNAWLGELAFPFGQYREGQRALAGAVYRACREGRRLFCCAPTGIGKTISVLYPALKAVGEGYGERVFYLTARTLTRAAAEDALALLGLQGQQPAAPQQEEQNPLEAAAFSETSGAEASAQADAPPLLTITLTAKDKLCFLPQRNCNPDACPWAQGYYNRVNSAVYSIIRAGGMLTRQRLEALARQHRLCPYELSLDIAEWCDLVVCDYNYVFDPVVHLQRFFEGAGGNYLFLVDEAHNLVERSREMYSAQLGKKEFFTFKKALPKNHKNLHRALGAVNNGFVALRKQVAAGGGGVQCVGAPPPELEKPLARFAAAAEDFLENYRGSEWEQELLALYFQALFYGRMAEEYDDTYITLLYGGAKEVRVRLFCLDPSARLNGSLSKGRAAVFFSATLEPLPYYADTLGGGPEAVTARLPSPFEAENLGLFIADSISTRYTDRQQTLPQVAQMLKDFVAARAGNYMVYCPNYAYMGQLHQLFSQENPQLETVLQQSGMSEPEREEFLQAFQLGRTNTLVGFCVLGGIFAEGVDLAGEQLIGCAVVGVGLPQLGPENDALRNYFDEKNGRGFEYAYQFPGMNKVLQAAGRVIRSENDRGTVLLIDSRFGSTRYKAMFPPQWSHWRRVRPHSLAAELRRFWDKQP